MEGWHRNRHRHRETQLSIPLWLTPAEYDGSCAAGARDNVTDMQHMVRLTTHSLCRPRAPKLYILVELQRPRLAADAAQLFSHGPRDTEPSTQNLLTKLRQALTLQGPSLES